MKSFENIYQEACRHHGASVIQARLPDYLGTAELAAIADDRLLSAMVRRVFRAGLKHSLVDSKWPAFERAFFGFEPQKVALMSDEQLERLMSDSSLIRHWGKIKAARVNAVMVQDISRDAGGFGRFLADWPDNDLVGLWLLLKKQGAQMGGQSAAAFLRMVGRDSFRLTPDVVAALIALDVVDRPPVAQRDLRLVQQAFNVWQAESDWPLSHISVVLAATVGWD